MLKKIKIYTTISLAWIIFIGYLTWWNGLKSPMLDKALDGMNGFGLGYLAVSHAVFYYIWKRKNNIYFEHLLSMMYISL